MDFLAALSNTSQSFPMQSAPNVHTLHTRANDARITMIIFILIAGLVAGFVLGAFLHTFVLEPLLRCLGLGRWATPLEPEGKTFHPFPTTRRNGKTR
jgi:hypothetical protein